MASTSLVPTGDFSSLSLYKVKSHSISSLTSQNQRRAEVLKRQKEKRDEQISQLRFSVQEDEQPLEENKPQWPPRQHRKKASLPCPIGMMLAEWLFSAPEDMSSWFVVPCPQGQRCIVVVQSHRTHVYSKSGQQMWTMHTYLPKHTILYCIYDRRSSIYHILDVMMWHGQDYSTQVECQCRFFMLLSLQGDSRLNEHFQILPRTIIEEQKVFPSAEDGHLFYHPLGFYESGYSPLVCWLKPFMIEEMLAIPLTYPIEKPIGYTTAQVYMFEEQSNRKEQQQQQSRRKSHKKEGEENGMSVDE